LDGRGRWQPFPIAKETLSNCLFRHSGPDPESIFAGQMKMDSRLRGNDGINQRFPKG